jgi:ribosomal protein S18 acetylase RimI-like enzyme
MNITIRHLRAEDFPAIARINYAPLIRERDTIYLVLAQDHRRFSFVAQDATGRLQGVALGLGAADASAVFLLNLWLAPAARHQGVGSMLMDCVEDAAARAGAQRVWMLSTDPAVDFYRRRGYRQTTDFLAGAAADYVARVKATPVLMKHLEAPPADGGREVAPGG